MIGNQSRCKDNFSCAKNSVFRFRQLMSKRLPHTSDNVCLAVDEESVMYAVGSKAHVDLLDARTLQVCFKCWCNVNGQLSWIVVIVFREYENSQAKAAQMEFGIVLSRFFILEIWACGSIDFFPGLLASKATYFLLERVLEPFYFMTFVLRNHWNWVPALTVLLILRLQPDGWWVFTIWLNYAFCEINTCVVQNRQESNMFHPQDGNQKYSPAVYTHCFDSSGTRVFVAGGPLQCSMKGNYIALFQWLTCIRFVVSRAQSVGHSAERVESMSSPKLYLFNWFLDG